MRFDEKSAPCSPIEERSRSDRGYFYAILRIAFRCRAANASR
jgi:hypothetical protein